MKKQTAIVWCVCMLYLLIIMQVIPITYAINDDVAMRDIASGSLTGTPDYHLIFIKAAFGWVLTGLYRCFEGIDWYGCVFLGMMVLCCGILLERWNSWCIQKGKKPWYIIGWYVIGITGILLVHMLNFQFTVTAAILAGTAIFLYGTAGREDNNFYGRTGSVLILLWLSFCVRSDVLFMAVPFGGLIFLAKADSIKRKVITALIAMVGLLGIMVFEKEAYGSEEWQAYLSYNDERSMVYDYYGVPAYEENREFYEKIGLKEYDVENLKRYNLCFVNDLETGKMHQIAGYAKEQYLAENSLGKRIKAGIKAALKGELDPENLLLNGLTKFVIGFNIFLSLKRKKKKEFLTNLGFLLCEGGLISYLGLQGRFPTRVGTALFLIELGSAAALLYQEELGTESLDWRKNKVRLSYITGALILLFGARLFSIKQKQQKMYQYNREYEILQDFYQEHEENVYFIAEWFVSGYSDIFHLQRKNSKANGFEMGGWLALSPIYEEELRQNGIECSADEAIIENENVYVILAAPSSKIEAHYEEKYHDIMWEQKDCAPVLNTEVPVFKIIGGETV